MRGFTLLEVLVVLVILGMAAALVAPALVRTVERLTDAADEDAVRRALHSLPGHARLEGRSFRFDAGERVDLPGTPWPEGWAVVALEDVVVHASGWCEGARVGVRGPLTDDVWVLVAPECRIEERDEA